MSNFDRKKAIELLNVDKYTKEISSCFDTINSGWVIFWKGVAVKPKGGNNHYYASFEAAKQGIDRNISFHWTIKEDLAIAYYGFKCDSKEWKEYFREDLQKKKNVKWDSLTKEEELLWREKRDEESKFDSFCNNTLKTVLIPKWLESGILEIKLI